MAEKSKKSKSKAAKKTSAKSTPKSNKGKIATILIVSVIIGFVALALNVGNLAKLGIEKVESDTLGVKVSIGKLDISLQDKQIEVTGLRVGNPQGYKGMHSLAVNTIRISADEITKELLTFNEITVSGTNINMEVTERGTNLTDIRKNIDRKASNKQKGAAEPTKVIIKSLNINEARVNPTMVLSRADLAPITIPNIRLSGIGQKSKGILVSEAIGQILDHVTKVATRSAAESGFLRGMNQDSLKDIQQSLDLPSGIMEQVRGLGDKVRGMFGN